MGPSAIRKLIRSFTSMRTVVFDAKGGQVLYLLNFVCDLKHVTMLFVKCHAPPTNMQTFKFRLWTHIWIPRVFTTVICY